MNKLNKNNKINNHYNNTVKAHFTFKFVNKLVYTCKHCKQTFKSNNHLYIYIKDDCLKKKPLFILTIVTFISILIQKTELKILFKTLIFIIEMNDFNLVVKSIIINLKNIKNYTFYR